MKCDRKHAGVDPAGGEFVKREGVFEQASKIRPRLHASLKLEDVLSCHNLSSFLFVLELGELEIGRVCALSVLNGLADSVQV